MSTDLLTLDKNLLFEEIARQIPGLIYINNINSMSNEWTNDFVTQLLGYTPQEIKNAGHQFYIDNIHPEDKPVFIDSMSFFMENPDQQWRGTYRIKHKNGEWKWVTAVGSVFKKNADGTPALILGIAFDITERSKTDERLKQLLKENTELKESLYEKQLSEQEQKVVRLLLDGKSSAQIAIELFISPLTVKTHRRNIYKKLNIKSINELK